jgi:hypothetical protein
LVPATQASEAPAPIEPRLFETMLEIEPGQRQVATMPVAQARWRLSPDFSARLRANQTDGTISPSFAAALRSRLNPQSAAPDSLVVPDEALLDLLPETDRLQWWARLGEQDDNPDYRWPFVIEATTLARLGREPGFVEAVRRIRRWGVVEESRVFFADQFALDDAFADSAQREEFFRRILGVKTRFVKLVADSVDAHEVAGRAAYWLAPGRSRVMEPLLAAVGRIEGQDRIDLAHILPRLARALLYTYPPDYQAAGEPSVDSALLAAGFFDADFDPQPVLASGFSQWLRENCERIPGRPGFGDIVVFEDAAITPWPYAMVYIADGILLGRRPTAYGPWELMREGEVRRLNPRLRGSTVACYRRREAESLPAAMNPRRWLPPAWPQRPELQELPPGPWGRLKFYDILLAPSSDLLGAIAPPTGQPRWVFANTTVSDVLRVIAEIEMPAETRRELQALFAGVRPDHENRLTVFPTHELVLATPAAFRERLFSRLEHGLYAADHAQLLTLPTQAGPADWFAPELLSPHARDIVLRLLYRSGPTLCLSDFGTLYHSLPEPQERLMALRALFRVPALVLLLERPSAADVPALSAYWSLDPQKNIGRMLESFAANDAMRFLDILHLLPPVARELLNTYLLAYADNPTPSCYWSAINFAVDRPDSRFLVTARDRGDADLQAWSKLAKDYTPVFRPSRLGDLVVYRRKSDGFMLHICAYVAAGVVYTKNGLGLSNPWCLMHLADMDALYLSGDSVERLCFQAIAPVQRIGNGSGEAAPNPGSL